MYSILSQRARYGKYVAEDRFVRSGNVLLNLNSLSRAGWHGYNWSSITSVYKNALDAQSLYLYFNDTESRPNDKYYHWRGFPVRCLVYYVKVSMEDIRAF